MKTRPVNTYSRQEWFRALGVSALCGILAICLWLAILQASRGAQGVNVALKQAVWLLPSVVALFTPVLLYAGRKVSKSSDI
jgi:hypothetical protein